MYAQFWKLSPTLCRIQKLSHTHRIITVLGSGLEKYSFHHVGSRRTRVIEGCMEHILLQY